MLLNRSLQQPVGRGQTNVEDDIVNIKGLFEQLDLLPRPRDGIVPVFDAPLEDTLRRYQNDRFLTIDGKMMPGGETERNLQRDLGLLPQQPPFSLSELDITGPVANGREGASADFKGVSKALGRLGLFDFDRTAEPLPFITRGLENGIRTFQQQMGLTIDGRILPGGETIGALKQAAAQTMAADSKSADREASPGGHTPQQKTPAVQLAQASGRDIEEEHRLLKQVQRSMEPRVKEALTARVTPPSHDPMPQAELGRRLTTDIRPEAIEEIGKAIDSREARPTLNFKEARAWAILSGQNARFDIKDNPKADRGVRLWRHHAMGVDTVSRYSNVIEKEATRHGLNPDLIKAIIYVENADGNFLGLNKAAEDIGLAKTILPMNINSRIWSGMGGIKEKEFRVPEKNIRAGVALIAAIRDRLDPKDRTPVKIGSIWHNLALENTDGLGAEIQKSFDEKSWTR